MATNAQALTGSNVVATSPVLAMIGADDDRADVIGVSLSLAAADSPACATLPRIAVQHGQPPRLVPSVAVATLRC